MKYILFLIFLIVIDCSPFIKNNSNVNVLLKLRRKERNEKILECIKSKGSQTLIKLLSENKSYKFGIILRENKNSITKEDKYLYHRCRKKIISELKINRRYKNKIHLLKMNKF